MSNSKSEAEVESESEAERLQRLLFMKLYTSSINGDLESVKLLVRMGADVNRGDSELGATPLIVASGNRRLEVVVTIA